MSGILTMLLLTDRASVLRALEDPELDADLRTLIGQRSQQLGRSIKLFVVQGGDTSDIINGALGFVITGDHADVDDYDMIQDHGLWFEVIFDTKAGQPFRVFVENGPGTELGIHSLCLVHFWPAEEDRQG